MREFAVILVISLCYAANCLAQEQQLKFEDGTSLTIIEAKESIYKSTHFTGRFAEKELSAIYKSLGKAGYLSTLAVVGDSQNPASLKNMRKFTKKQSRSFFKNFARITTAYDLEQESSKFYLSALNSIDLSKVRDLAGHTVKVKIIIAEMRSGSKFYYVPVIKSLN